MIHKYHLLVVVLVAATSTSAAASAGPLVYVADVEQLYAAVNNEANKGAIVVLAAGTYSLSPGHRNDGRLELQQDMSLYGVAGDRAAVVIDATALPQASFFPNSVRTGVIRTGLGTNAVEWLTIAGNSWAAGSVETDLGSTAQGNHQIRVAHVVADGSARGADIRNIGKPNAGRRIDAEIVDNEFSGPAVVRGMSEGIRLANFAGADGVGADGGVIVATLSGNRAHGFQIGCIAANNRSSNAMVEVRSSGNRFFANALGCLIAGGLSQAVTGMANANSTIFEAHGSEFVDNTAPIPGVDPGGIRVVGGLSTIQSNVASYNTVSVALWGSKVSESDNPGNGFEAFGALPGTAGTGNRVTITLHGVSKKTDVVATPAGTNTVTVIR
jgi:hypothetical protein